MKPLFKALDYAAKSNHIPSRLAYSICDDSYYELKNRTYESKVEEDIHYLTPQQLQEFIDVYPLMKHDRTREYMDMFLFAYDACGLRFSDILTLEWQHINWEERTLTKNLFKEKTRHQVCLNDSAMETLKRWKAKDYSDRFVFNLLP